MKFIHAFCIFCLLSCNDLSKVRQPNFNDDSTILKWNNMTLNSLEKNLQNLPDSIRLRLYKNSVASFKESNEINEDGSITHNSIRYLFLNELIKNTKITDTFYVVETMLSGEKITLANFVIYPKALDSAQVNIFEYRDRKWVPTHLAINVPFNSLYEFQVKPENFGIGANKQDLIVTKIVNNQIFSSEYYLYRMLPHGSSFNRILLLLFTL